jgi:hypothetical protein
MRQIPASVSRQSLLKQIFNVAHLHAADSVCENKEVRPETPILRALSRINVVRGRHVAGLAIAAE